MNRVDERASRLVAFWRAVEMFSPQTVRKTDTLTPDAKQVTLEVPANHLAPWQPGHPIAERRLDRGRTWRFTVYGGLYKLDAVRETLASVCGGDTQEPDGRQGGTTALFAFTLDGDGRLVEDSAALASCAWAVGRTVSPGPGDPRWLDGFEDEQRGFSLALNRLAPPEPSDQDKQGQGSTMLAEIGQHAVGAARDAVKEGAKATGQAVTAATAVAVGSVAGPVLGGIAGAVAGKFAEKLLTPPEGEKDQPPDRDAEPAAEQALRAPRMMTAADLHEFVEDLAEHLGVTQALRPSGVRVHCRLVRDTDNPSDHDFLNSQIAEDLARLQAAVRDGDIGTGLRRYLADSPDAPPEQRVDVRLDGGQVIAGVEPKLIPAGRWPTDPDKPLVLSQQFAVNQIMAELGDAPGIFAVNGPPGTGKTTMLRDVLAAVVVDRAARLAELRDPADAFAAELGSVQLSKNYRAPIRSLDPALTGFEIVLATQGNDAAANVTKEIPGTAAIAPRPDEVLDAAISVDYFTALASHLLGEPAWGLVAAQLGKRSLRGKFAQGFWWGLKNADLPGMLDLLKQARTAPETVPDWDGAVAGFQRASAEVQRLAAERQQVADAIAEVPACQRHIDDSDARLREVERARHELAAESNRFVEKLAAAASAYQAVDDEYQNHRLHKPGFWVSLSTGLRAGREWHSEHAELGEQRAERKRHWNQVDGRLTDLHERLARADAEFARLRNDRDVAARRLADAHRHIEAARRRWPHTVPLSTNLSDEQMQRCAPWADRELTEARNRLFLAALRLHKAFALGAGVALQHNLAVAVRVIGNNLPVPPPVRLAALRSLFLVVPLVSTTFASLPRLFADVPREALGWLLIDEAGQATPQQAAGGIWRARRTVIVGDPQQLEPVVTLPSSAQHTLRRIDGVGERWLPDNTSVQLVADRHARFGTNLPDVDGGDPVWIGTPLRVHRRCDRPMFDISNAIAYGGDLMIYGTVPRPGYPGRNRWLDVRGDASGNWVPAEGDALADLLDELAMEGCHDIRVVSPFREVVGRAKDRVGKARAERVGTIHTVQGQEADVVIIVLGTAPSKDGARRWAARSPNLLNVAVSRAKRRLYVIGNKQSWRHLRYFDVLAATLDGS